MSFFDSSNQKQPGRIRLETLFSLSMYWLIFSAISSIILLYPLLLLLPTTKMSVGLFSTIWLIGSGVAGFLLPEKILPQLEQKIK